MVLDLSPATSNERKARESVRTQKSQRIARAGSFSYSLYAHQLLIEEWLHEACTVMTLENDRANESAELTIEPRAETIIREQRRIDKPQLSDEEFERWFGFMPTACIRRLFDDVQANYSLSDEEIFQKAANALQTCFDEAFVEFKRDVRTCPKCVIEFCQKLLVAKQQGRAAI